MSHGYTGKNVLLMPVSRHKLASSHVEPLTRPVPLTMRWAIRDILVSTVFHQWSTVVQELLWGLADSGAEGGSVCNPHVSPETNQSA